MSQATATVEQMPDAGRHDGDAAHASQLDDCAAALTEVWCHLASFMPGGRVDRIRDATLVSTSAPSEDLKGPLTVTADANATTIADARALAHRLGRMLAVDLIVGHSPEALSAVSELGFERVAARRFMVLHRRSVATLREHLSDAAVIGTDRHLASMGVLQVEAFGMRADAVDALVRPQGLLASPHGVVVEGDDVVSMATAHPTATGIGVFGVATRETARRRGLASAAIAAAVVAAMDRTDAELIWLQADDDVAEVYRSLGFATVARSEVWIDAHL